MPLKSTFKQYEDDSAPTRAKPVHTPGAGKYRDPITGKQPDDYFALGTAGTDISTKIDRASRNNGRSTSFKSGKR